MITDNESETQINPELAVSRAVRRHRAARGRQADWGFAETDELRRCCGITDDPTGWAKLLEIAVDALWQDLRRETSLPADSRWWSQLINRLTNALVMHESASMKQVLGAVDAIAERIQRLDFSMHRADTEAWRIVKFDLIGSMAGATAWGFFGSTWKAEAETSGVLHANQVDSGLWVAAFVDDVVLNEYLVLYSLRFQLRANLILEFLDGHDYRDTDPVKAGFAFFAHAVTGEWARAEQATARFAGQNQVPLVMAKLVSTALHHAPPPLIGRTEFELLESTLRLAISVWSSVGGDMIVFTAAAELAAMRGDAAGVNLHLDEAMLLAESKDTPTFEDFEALTRARVRLIDRVTILSELDEIGQAKQAAQDALEMAQSAAAQTPTVVGLFTAVIALVLGASQLAQGLSFDERVLVVAALGTVLLGFLSCLAVITGHRRNGRFGALGLVGSLAALVVTAAALLSVILRSA